MRLFRVEYLDREFTFPSEKRSPINSIKIQDVQTKDYIELVPSRHFPQK